MAAFANLLRRPLPFFPVTATWAGSQGVSWRLDWVSNYRLLLIQQDLHSQANEEKPGWPLKTSPLAKPSSETAESR